VKSAALLPTPGDPFQVLYWLKNYERVWRGEVDELHVLVNGQPDDRSREVIRAQVERVGGIYSECGVTGGHGQALAVLVDQCDADIVVLVEDDALVRRSGKIASLVAQIGSGTVDVIGSPRGAMSQELVDAAKEKWGLCFSECGDHGHGMWPAFVFTRRECLLATDQNYAARGWTKGETVSGLGYVVGDQEVAADTFGATAFQLRDLYRVAPEPQHKGPWTWRETLNSGYDPAWFHIGSLSSSGNLVLEVAELTGARKLTDPDERGEWGHRLNWWERFLRTAGPVLPDHQARYRQNLDRLMEVMGVADVWVRRWDQICDEMVTWDDS